MRFRVNIIESERGWGQKIDEVKYFDSKDYDGDADKALQAAKNFVKEAVNTRTDLVKFI